MSSSCCVVAQEAQKSGASQPNLTAKGDLPLCVTRHSLVRRRYHGYGFCAARSLDGVEQITFKTADYRRQRPFSLSTPVLDNWKAHARIAESSISRGRYLRLYAQALSVYARLSSIPAITPISSSDLRCVIDAISLPVRLRCHARPGGCLPRDGRNQRIDPPSPRH